MAAHKYKLKEQPGVEDVQSGFARLALRSCPSRGGLALTGSAEVSASTLHLLEFALVAGEEGSEQQLVPSPVTPTSPIPATPPCQIPLFFFFFGSAAVTEGVFQNICTCVCMHRAPLPVFAMPGGGVPSLLPWTNISCL